MMLEQEIEKYLSGQTLCRCDSVSYRNIKNLVLGFAEPREKCIAELEKKNAELKEKLEALEKRFEPRAVLDIINEIETERKLKAENEQAKEIIRKLIDYPKIYGQASGKYKYECDLAEQFISEE